MILGRMIKEIKKVCKTGSQKFTLHLTVVILSIKNKLTG